jgi:transcriptional regulator of acetoin/glycerol metabolism
LWALDEVLGASTGSKTALTEEMVEAAVTAAGGNVTAAATSLGISRGKLLRYRKRAK